MLAKKRRVVTYERVSSEDQRDRETIKTQTDELAARLLREPDAVLVERFVDDGVSGTIPLADRPAGRRLLQALEKGEFDEIWVYNVSRLGREAIDLMWLGRRLQSLGVRLYSLQEGMQDNLLGFDVNAVVADSARRSFLKVTADGTNRAAREGRYTGGPPPLGYRVDGSKQNARIALSDALMWGTHTEADIARLIFQRLAEGRSCSQIAIEFTALGVPTVYAKEGRGVRGKSTQAVWRPNRIYSIATNTVYKGLLRFGLHSKKPGREVITAPVQALVSEEMWDEAQLTLRRNKIIPDGKRTLYLLRSLMVCDSCGLRYAGCTAPDGRSSYRCNGQLVARRLELGRCPGKTIRRALIDDIVWSDIERFLREPGDLLDELHDEFGGPDQMVADEAERVLCDERLSDLSRQRQRALDLNVRDRMTDAELDQTLVRVDDERRVVEDRRRELGDHEDVVPPAVTDLLGEVHTRLDSGLTAAQRQEIARLLVRKIEVHTEFMESRDKQVNIRIEYAFPCVVPSQTASRYRRRHS